MPRDAKLDRQTCSQARINFRRINIASRFTFSSPFSYTSNSTPRLTFSKTLPSYLLSTLLLYFLFIFFLPRCTVPDFPSVYSLAIPCHFFLLSSNIKKLGKKSLSLQAEKRILTPFNLKGIRTCDSFRFDF